MKSAYRPPTLTEFGALERITLGTGGSVPDLLNGQNTNTNCPGATFVSGGQTLTTTSCSAITS